MPEVPRTWRPGIPRFHPLPSTRRMFLSIGAIPKSLHYHDFHLPIITPNRRTIESLTTVRCTLQLSAKFRAPHGRVIPSEALFSGAEGSAFVFRSASAADAQATRASSPALPSFSVPSFPCSLFTVHDPRFTSSVIHFIPHSIVPLVPRSLPFPPTPPSFRTPPPGPSAPTPHAVLRDCETVKLWSAPNQ